MQTMENEDTLSEVFSTIAECTMILEYHIGSKYDGEIDFDYFIRWLEKAIKIDRRTTYVWMKKNKNRFDERMLNYADTRFKRSIRE